MASEIKTSYGFGEVSGRDSMLIPNAGLVLLAPYLEDLFVLLGLVVVGATEKQFVDQAAISRGVSLLRYLAKGSVGGPNLDMALNTLLCGGSPTSGIPEPTMISDTDAKTCDDLLCAVIARWSVIRETSIAGLRETFLQRNGQLTRRGNNWRLQVERKTLDLLVDQIPWSFALVQYRWMPEPIHVTWQGRLYAPQYGSASPARRAATVSPMASDDVRPGLSMPKSAMSPSRPWLAGPSRRKSGWGSPGPWILGLRPA